MSAVLVEGLEICIAGRTILQVPMLQVASGERLAVIGPNGSGKSTLLRVLGGFVPAAGAQVQVLGCVPQARPHSREARGWSAQVGQIHQGLHLVGRLTAVENVLIGALHRVNGWQSWLRWFPAPLVDEALAALEQVGLLDKAGQRTDQLSGGERQKVSLARLMLQKPRLILADEPTSALDPRATQQVGHWLRQRFHGVTTITVVHQPDLLPLLADRVLGLRDGRIVFDSPVASVTAATLTSLYQDAT